MRILCITWGSRGDFQPFLALGRALQAAGHEVTLGGLAYAEPWVTAAGLAFLPADPDAPLAGPDSVQAGRDSSAAGHGSLTTGRDSPPNGPDSTPAGRGSFVPSNFAAGATHMYKLGDPIRSARYLVANYVAPCIVPTYRTLFEAAAQSDLIVSHHAQMAGLLLGQKLAKPVVTVCFVPHTIPSGFAPAMYTPNLGRLGNRLMWRFGQQVMAWMCDAPLNEARRQLGFPPARNAFLDGGYSNFLHFIPISPHVFPPQADWPHHYHLTSYWFLDQAAGYTPDPGLEAFLAAGPPPVLVTFGSMVAEDVDSLNQILIAAVRQAGVRAILQAGWAGLGEGVALPDTMFATGEVPHDWLMPRVAAAVHHGGAGTTAAALRAGLPSVVVPHFADQPAWAVTLRRLGVSPPAIPRSRLGVDVLARALRTVTTDAAMRTKAGDLGRAIRGEDGLGTAVGLIEGAIHPRSTPTPLRAATRT